MLQNHIIICSDDFQARFPKWSYVSLPSVQFPIEKNGVHHHDADSEADIHAVSNMKL